MKFSNVFFINGTAYSGKSTMVKLLAEKYNGIACYKNYHDILIENLNSNEFPNLTYAREPENWNNLIKKTPDEYEKWIDGCITECSILELQILEKLSKQNKKIFVNTNIPTEILKEVSDKEHVLIMLSEPNISVNRFFEQLDKEKEFLYQLLLKEKNPDNVIENFKECIKKINSTKIYYNFFNSGFNVIFKNEKRTIEETLSIVERLFKLKSKALTQ